MTTPIIEATGLVKRFSISSGAFSAKTFLKAVDGVDLRIRPGETLGIAGESGCGKSTLGKLLMGLITADAGEIAYRGRPLRELSGNDLVEFRKDVQMIFQDPFSSLNPRMRVGDLIGEPLKIHKLASGAAYRDKVVDLMSTVGLSADHFHRYPHEFSGGQRQRIGIARALAVSPKLIIADEPVSALDLSIQAQIINVLLELKRSFGIAFIVIAHDLAVIRHISDRIAIMYLGKIVETGNRDDIFNKYRHPYTEALLSAIPQINPALKKKRIVLKGDLPSPLSPPGGCPFHPRCPYAEGICASEVPELLEQWPGHLAACHFSKKLFE